jgi:hypothetical protein
MKKFPYKFPRLWLVLQHFIMHFLKEHKQFLITQENAVVSRTCISYFIQENVQTFEKIYLMLHSIWTVNTVFWYVTPCIPVKSYKIFGETSCLHLQGIIYTVEIEEICYSKTVTFLINKMVSCFKWLCSSQSRPWEPKIPQKSFSQNMMMASQKERAIFYKVPFG